MTVMSKANQPERMRDMPSPDAAISHEPPPVKAGKKRGVAFRIFRFLLITALCIAALTAAINVYMMLSTRDKIFALADTDNLSADCILVLGAGVTDTTPSSMLADRLQVGIGAYNAKIAPKLLMSGDHGLEHYDEVNVMKAFAIQRGVPSSDVFMDHAGFSTYESMYRARDIFQVKKVVIVTQHYHLYRAIYNAERMGLEAYGIPSDLQKYAGQPYFDFREYLARVKDFFWGMIQPYPTYLGESIPVTGNGDVTND